VATERETEVRNVQEQSSRLQAELTRLRQELQDKTSQEDTLRQQMAEKEEKTKKALVNARQKINQLTGERIFSYLIHCILQPVEVSMGQYEILTVLITLSKNATVLKY